MVTVPVLALLAAAASPSDTVDKLLQAEMKSSHIPGVSVVITKDDKVIKRSAFGLADIETGGKMTTDQVFETGSITKSFTATLILQLVQDGTLRLEDTVGERLKDCPAEWKAITLRQLLNQMSGLPDYAVVPGLGLVDQWTYEEWLAKLPTVPFDFATGTSFAYSNTNYLLLGKIAEQAAGKPYTDLIKERIFDKAGMTRSYVSDQMTVIPNRAHGYYYTGDRLINGMFIAPGFGDGTYINHPDDLISFERALREGKLLEAKEDVRLLQTSAKLPSGRKTGYGMGWFVRQVNGVEVLSHGGNSASCFSSMTRIPSKNMTVIVMGNVYNVSGDNLALRIAQEYVPELRPRKYEAKPDPEPAFTAKLLATLKSLGTDQQDDSMLDSEMVARLKTGRGQMSLQGLKRFAAVSSLTFLETALDDPDTVYRYRGMLDGKPILFTLVVTKDKKLYSASARPE